jgi:hypothetical protein
LSALRLGRSGPSRESSTGRVAGGSRLKFATGRSLRTHRSLAKAPAAMAMKGSLSLAAARDNPPGMTW